MTMMDGGWGGAAPSGGPGMMPPPDIAEEERTDVLKLILYELNSCIAPRSARLDAIQAVLSELDHVDEFKHDEELDLQADKILFQRLAFAHSVDGGPWGEEAGLVASALEMVYRASRARIALSFNEVGEAMLPLLVEIARDPNLPADGTEGGAKGARAAGDAAESGSLSLGARSEERIQRITEEVKRKPEPGKNMDPDDDDDDDDGNGHDGGGGGGGDRDRDTAENDRKPVANGLGPLSLNGEAALHEDPHHDHEEKKGDSYENLAHAGMGMGMAMAMAGEVKRKGTGSGAGSSGAGVEVETVYSESAPEEEASAARFGNDHATATARQDDDEESRPQVRFNEEADVQQVSASDHFSAEKQPSPSPLAVSRVLKVLRYFSRVLSAMIPMAHHPGLLDALVYQLGRRPEQEWARGISMDAAGSHVHYQYGADDTDDDGLDERQRRALHYDALARDLAAVRIDAVATVVNLACAEENKMLMVYHPGLLDAVLTSANNDPSEEAREHAAIVLMNLAYAEENKVHMAGQDSLLDTLVRLVGDPSPFTRRYASAALFTLACVAANTARMARHRDGAILAALVRVLLDDPIDEARINAAEALFNMARNSDAEDDTVLRMGNHPDLLRALAQAVVSDYSADVRAYAARALEWLSADLHHPMQCHGNLLSALTTAAQWTKTTCVAEAFKTQSTIADNRAAMVRHDGLLDALADLALLDGINDEEVSACAITAIERLTKEESTRRVMVKNEGIMTALTKATFTKSGLDGGNEEELEADVGESLDGVSLVSGVSTSQLTKNALKNLADAL